MQTYFEEEITVRFAGMCVDMHHSSDNLFIQRAIVLISRERTICSSALLERQSQSYHNHPLLSRKVPEMPPLVDSITCLFDVSGTLGR
jgi:hypothetical protein